MSRNSVQVRNPISLEELSPEVLRIIGLCSRFLLRRNELVPQLFRLTPDFIF